MYIISIYLPYLICDAVGVTFLTQYTLPCGFCMSK